jgi:hypothetical protein
MASVALAVADGVLGVAVGLSGLRDLSWTLLDGGFVEIPLEAAPVLCVRGPAAAAPRDPFDRLLLTQAEREGCC